MGIGSSVRIAAGPGAETVAGMETQVGTGLIDRIGQDTVIVRRAPIVLKNSTVRSVRIGPAADVTGRAIPSIQLNPAKSGLIHSGLVHRARPLHACPTVSCQP